MVGVEPTPTTLTIKSARVFVVSGGTGGIGQEAVRSLLAAGSTVITGARNVTAANFALAADGIDSLHTSVMMQAPGLGLNLLSYRPTGLLLLDN